MKKIGKLPSGHGVLGVLVRDAETIKLDSISDHPESYGFPPHHPPMHSFLGVPVIAGGTAFGNLYLTEKTGGFTDDDVAFAEALSRIAGSAVSRARLHRRLQAIAVLEDRERIARDLHDSVIQDLYAVGLGLQGITEALPDQMAAAALEEAVDRLDNAVERLRAYISDLRTTRSRHQLDDRLQELVSRMGSAYPTSVILDMGSTDLGDDRLEDEVLKIVSEALSNALRHSSASKVEVTVDASEGWCTVVVRDDGNGFDPESITPGMGLANLEARSAAIGGSMTIETAPGEGTRVEVRLPVR